MFRLGRVRIGQHENRMEVIAGIHPVREALRAGRPLERVCLIKDVKSPRLDEIVALAKKARVPVRHESRESLDRMVKGLQHQGVVAFEAASKHAAIEDFLRVLSIPFVVVCLTLAIRN
ncbi:MAG: hypothetical protein MZV70_19225, partial [Desulfobacterales bacterium]|nr:hypothetical protein [Desulfobacterales bacterium]